MTHPRKLNKYKYRPDKQCAKVNVFLFGCYKDEPRNKGNPGQKAQVRRRKGETQEENRQKRKT